MRFAWDPKKADTNRRKHGVNFEEATSALRDAFSATAHEPDHSDDEERFVTFGIFPKDVCLRYRIQIEAMPLGSYRLDANVHLPPLKKGRRWIFSENLP